MRRCGFFLCVVLASCLLCTNANADLILTFTGSVGSNVMSYEASGSITVSQEYTGFNSGIAVAPIAGDWTSGFDSNLGDILRNGMDTTLNDDLVLTGGGVSYRKNNSEFGVLDTLDLDGSDSIGGDDIELDPTVNIDYPDLVIGDTLSWIGSGTFTLEGGETYDSLFIQEGTFSRSLDGGNYTVIVQTAVPEPGSLLVLSGLSGYLIYRRRRKAKMEDSIASTFNR